MRWAIKWGPYLKGLQARARKTGEVPDALRRRPKLQVHDAPFAEAFWALSGSRTFGFNAPNPIALTEIAAYCSMAGIASLTARAKYLRLIQAMDRAWLEEWAAKQPKT